MTVFNKKIIENIQERKFVGANLPLQIYSYLAMRCIDLDVSKSSIINVVLQKWKEEMEQAVSIESLVENIALKAVHVFSESKKKQIVFRATLSTELEKKGVDKGSINLILKRFDGETK